MHLSISNPSGKSTIIATVKPCIILKSKFLPLGFPSSDARKQNAEAYSGRKDKL